jgi:hypothetical protein
LAECFATAIHTITGGCESANGAGLAGAAWILFTRHVSAPKCARIGALLVCAGLSSRGALEETARPSLDLP